MLLVKTKIGPSAIQGIGLFADQFIAKGTHLWEFTPGLDVQITFTQLKTLSPTAKASFLK
jgi:hypothetical protein